MLKVLAIGVLLLSSTLSFGQFVIRRRIPPPAAGGSSPTLVQHKTNASAANAATVAVTVTSTGSGHQLIVAAGTGNANNTVTGVTDNQSNVYSQVSGAQANANGNLIHTDVWACLSSCTSGVTSVTITFSASGTFDKEAWVFETTGLTAVDTAAVQNNGTAVASVATGASVTTSVASGFVVGIAITTSSVTQNPNSGNEFTSGGDIDANGNAAASLLSASAAAHQPAWHTSAATPLFASSTAAFK